MRDINRAERLLSLFTSPDSAAGIAGDLSEERGTRGGVWFWRQVLGTAFSLGRGALFEAPVAVLWLVALGGLMLALSGIAGSAVAGYLTTLFNPSVKLQLLLFALLALPAQTALSWYGARLAGALLVAASPQRGMLACVLLFFTVELLLLSLGVLMIAGQPVSAWLVLWIFGLVGPVFLLRGGARARLRRMAQVA